MFFDTTAKNDQADKAHDDGRHKVMKPFKFRADINGMGLHKNNPGNATEKGQKTQGNFCFYN